MKKEYLDKLYELRTSVQFEIDVLVERSKAPTDGSCEGCEDALAAELRTRRSQQESVNHLIEAYLSIHRKQTVA